MRGKLIVLEGNDCSGKETQAKYLERALNQKNIPSKKLSFPNYQTPTGRIIGACYLGKEELCQDYLTTKTGWFKEGASNVDGLVSALYYAADRRYNMAEIEKLLESGTNVILDRYTFSNMAHQGGKFLHQEERFQFFKKIETLEFDILNLPKPDLVIFLYVPFQVTIDLQEKRDFLPDQIEKDKKYLKRAEQTYLELKALYHFKMVECVVDHQMRKIEDIHNEVLEIVMANLENVS